jgi:hypothetical protein
MKPKQVLCVLMGHKYARFRYPGSPDGYYLKCARCDHERDDLGGGSAIGTGALGG